jgi:hypothetical protein
MADYDHALVITAMELHQTLDQVTAEQQAKRRNRG